MRKLYWIIEGLKMDAAIFAASFVYSFLIASQKLAEGGWMQVMQMGAIYTLVMGGAMMLISSVNLYWLHVPLALMFSSTRKETYIGLQYYRLAIAVPVLLVSSIMCTMTYPEFRANTWMVVVLGMSAFMILGGIGGILGYICYKLSKAALMGIMLFTLFLVIILVTAMTIGFAVFLKIADSAIWIVFGLGIFVHIIGNVMEYKRIKGFCVR